MYKLLLIISLTVACLTAKANPDSIMAYMRHAMLFNRYYPQEKVYLHFDNTGYFKGETIWFKAYVTRTDTRNRTDLSRVLYVELLNPSGDVIETRKLKIENGEAQGSIKLEQIFSSGFYEVRAYTRYMTNWGTDACFSRVFPVFKEPQTPGDYSDPKIDMLSHKKRLPDGRLDENGDEKEEENPFKKLNKAPKVILYPESGNLVKGLRSRMAYSIVYDDSIDRGIVEITPDEESDRFEYTDRKGKKRDAKLPEILESGVSMTMNLIENDSVRIHVESTPDLMEETMGCVIMHEGDIVTADTFHINDSWDIAYPREDLPKGVNQITIFGGNGKRHAERLFFICPEIAEKSNNISVCVKNTEFAPCGKMEVELLAEPESSMSFSAVDAETMTGGKDGNALTWMLLSSELKGYIDNPEFYFEADDEEHRRAADLLTMIQGWRRYDWELMAGLTVWDKFQPIESGLMIHGVVKDKKNNNVINGASLRNVMYNSKGENLEGEVTTDSLGRYCFTLPDIYGEWNLFIQTKNDRKKQGYNAGIDRYFSPKGRNISLSETKVLPIDTSAIYCLYGENQEVIAHIDKHNVVTDQIVVKAKRVWDRVMWNNESNARHYSALYYDCEQDLEKIIDSNEEIPYFVDWLKSKNNLFEGETSPTDVLIMHKAQPKHGNAIIGDAKSGKMKIDFNVRKMDEIDTVKAIYDWFDFEKPEYNEYMIAPPPPWKKFYRDGLTYKNRPIVWIIDNQYCTITGFKMRSQKMGIRFNYSDNDNNMADLPELLDEVKKVYISENPKSMQSHIRCSEIEDMEPVIIYCFTNRSQNSKIKGLRRTHFQGYNVPETFEMEDYSIMPPMEDFRRTLYWNPNVKTDKNGKASIEFYNNSSCTQMFISAEGITKDGKFIVSGK